MSMHAPSLLFVAFLSVQWTIAQDTWCGKPYQKGSPHITLPSNSYFPVPSYSETPLVKFKCTPHLQPYILHEDATAHFIVDAEITHDVGTPLPSSLKYGSPLVVTITAPGVGILTGGRVSLGSQGTELTAPLSLLLKPQTDAYNITCTAHSTDLRSTFEHTTLLRYLHPNPYGGSTVKADMRTGGILAKSKGAKNYEPIIPYGFYTSFSNYLAKNLTTLNDIKALGYNMVHPVPTFDNDTIRDAVIERMEELGLWLMYDMRNDYRNLTSVASQTTTIRSRSNLLLYYTADEPDGWQYALNSTSLASDTIRSLDPYHPVSLVLNCFDYYFTEYTVGGSPTHLPAADIVMQDAYTIGINASHSTVWDTECTSTYGDCGCDDCRDGAGLRDVSLRLDTFRDRLRWLGKERSIGVWSVPQAFGQESYWPRYPTGAEFVAQAVISFLHGATAIVPWIAPTPENITSASSAFAHTVLPLLPRFILPSSQLSYPSSNFKLLANATGTNTVEVGLWTIQGGKDGLLMAVNVGGSQATIEVEGGNKWALLYESVGGTNLKLINGGEKLGITLGALGSAVWVRN